MVTHLEQHMRSWIAIKIATEFLGYNLTDLPFRWVEGLDPATWIQMNCTTLARQGRLQPNEDWVIPMQAYDAVVTSRETDRRFMRGHPRLTSGNILFLHYTYANSVIRLSPGD